MVGSSWIRITTLDKISSVLRRDSSLVELLGESDWAWDQANGSLVLSILVGIQPARLTKADSLPAIQDLAGAQHPSRANSLATGL